MPKLIKGAAVIEDDWEVLDDDAPLPDSGHVIISLSRYIAERDRGSNSLTLAVQLAPDDEPQTLVDAVSDLNQLPVIALQFPGFADGRCLSTAVLLRTRFGYSGELRAVGDVAQDQLSYMVRCGIDAFAIRPDKDIDEALNGLETVSEFYQGSVTQPQPLFRRR